MDAATMVAINNLNMLTVMSAMQQTQNFITFIDSEKEYEDMSGSMLDQYVGRDCVVSLFNEVGAIKADSSRQMPSGSKSKHQRKAHSLSTEI